ncbi:MAG: shufflon system plasmid conjugative transfer pilus tip adhesin PilV [Polaromonas sp.]|nr:shufflon system plasmid conjugative transfer pilus tip adhesin PilV [Polaromonas sp.]
MTEFQITFRNLRGAKRNSAGLARQAGITLVEVVASLAIIAAASVGLVVMSDTYAEEAKASVTASQLRSFGNAAQSYIKDNYAAVQAVATDTAPAMIDAATLVAAGALPSDFATQNSFGQTMCVLVLEPTAGRLQALVVSEGGRSVDDLSLGGIASMIGGSGGAVYDADPSVIRGASGGWQVPAAAFDDRTNNIGRRCDGSVGNVRLASGTPVMALWFENGATSTAFLSRDAVPGRPELNEMNTPLVMNSEQTSGGACTMLGAISRDSTGGLLTCQGGTWRNQGSTFWKDPVATFAALPTCNAAALNQTRIVGAPTVGSGPRAYTCNGSAWEPLSIDDSGNMHLPSTLTTGKLKVSDVVTEGTACASNGLVAADSTGMLLSCRSGLWGKLTRVATGTWSSALSGGTSGALYTTSALTLDSGVYQVMFYNCIDPGSMSQSYYLSANTMASWGTIQSGFANVNGNQMHNFSGPTYIVRVLSVQASVLGVVWMPAGGYFTNIGNGCSQFIYEKIY